MLASALLKPHIVHVLIMAGSSLAQCRKLQLRGAVGTGHVNGLPRRVRWFT